MVVEFYACIVAVVDLGGGAPGAQVPPLPEH